MTVARKRLNAKSSDGQEAKQPLAPVSKSIVKLSIVLWSLPSEAVALNWVENERFIMDWKQTPVILTATGFPAVTSGCKKKIATEKAADKANATAGKASDAIQDGIKKAGEKLTDFGK